MKTVFYSILIFLGFFSVDRGMAQKVGQTVLPPDFWNQLEKKVGNDSLWSTLSGKAMLLDFGTTYCPPCVSSLNKLSESHSSYDDKMHVFFITNQNEKTLSSWKAKRGWIDHLGVSILQDDGYFRKVFPHIAEPYVIWIGFDKKVQYITNGEKLTDSIIRRFIEQESLSFVDVPERYLDARRGLLGYFYVDSIQTKSDPFSVSIILPYQTKLYPSYQESLDTVTNKIKFTAVNQGIIDLYKFAFGKQWYRSLPNPFEEIEVSDINKYYRLDTVSDADDWNVHNRYCVEYYGDAATAQQSFVELLDKNFKMKSALKKVAKKSWVLTETSLKASSIIGNIIQKDDYANLFDLIAVLESDNSKPFTKESKYYARHRFLKIIPRHLLKSDLEREENLSQINFILEPLGMQLEIQVREAEVLFLTETTD